MVDEGKIVESVDFDTPPIQSIVQMNTIVHRLFCSSKNGVLSSKWTNETLVEKYLYVLDDVLLLDSVQFLYTQTSPYRTLPNSFPDL
jgi:hypothetical protein